MNFLIALECAECGARADPAEVANTCIECGSTLLAVYDLEAARESLTKETWSRRPAGLWRYRELLPISRRENEIDLGEGGTLELRLRGLGAEFGLDGLWLKDEGANPTGTFKARGAATGASKARELGLKEWAMPTAGNAGSAWAAYAARAGADLHVAMPADTPGANIAECVAYGAKIYLVDGLISDAGRLIADACARYGWYDVSTLKEPYRVEGKKTMGFEIAEQFDWDLPDVILYPTGGGVGLIGLWKAFNELEALGWIGPRRPRLVSVQAEGCAPVVRAYEENAERCELWENASTSASGLRVPKPFADRLVLRILRETDGTAVGVSEEEIKSSMTRLARLEGLYVCPEGAASIAAIERLRADGWIGGADRVVMLNTGNALKYVDLLALPELPTFQPDGALIPS
ncbi:MAG: threonine synthase [Chloroflexi bacterium]|nr:threonine synthase [Chloroflexota bacterium]MCY3937988.1 threonine synthase [Chloroflexota bacterium]